jgi:hypothetical protein
LLKALKNIPQDVKEYLLILTGVGLVGGGVFELTHMVRNDIKQNNKLANEVRNDEITNISTQTTNVKRLIQSRD